MKKLTKLKKNEETISQKHIDNSKKQGKYNGKQRYVRWKGQRRNLWM